MANITGAFPTAGILLACTALGACSSLPPPREEVSQAKLAVTQAGQSQAAQYAPAELAKAQQELDSAQRAMDAERYVEARRLAEKALVDAQLAEARAEAAKDKQAAAELGASIEALRNEAIRAGGQ